MTNVALTETMKALGTKRSQARHAWETLEARKKAVLAAGPRAVSPSSPEFQALDLAGRQYDALKDEIASGERTLSRMAEAVLSSDGQLEEASPALDLRRFEAAFRGWQSRTQDALRDPSARFGSSPSFPLIPRADVQNVLTTAGYPSVPWRRPGIVPLPLADLSLLDLISIVPVTNEIVEAPRESSFSNAAVETEQTYAAGQSALSWTMTSTACQWLPTTLTASRQLLDDLGRLREFLRGRVMYAVRARLQSQIISGNGSEPNLRGILNTPDLPSVAHESGDVLFDNVQQAITAVRMAGKGTWTPNTVLMSPADYGAMVTAKNGDGVYYAPNGPLGDSAPTVWGLPVVQHVELPEGSPIVCDSRAMELYVREDVTVTFSDSHADHFVRGLVEVLASGRFGFSVLDTAAFCQVADFNE